MLISRTSTRTAGPARLQNLEAELKKQFKNRDLFSLLAATFQALGDSTRVQIIWALSRAELCVGDIAELLEMSQPAVSHHLRTLRNMRLVKVRRQGRTSFYQLDDDHISRLLAEGIEHVEDLL